MRYNDCVKRFENSGSYHSRYRICRVMKSINKIKEQSSTYRYESQYRVIISSLKHKENLHYFPCLINLMISVTSENVLQ